ncbi:NAD-P-binding protein [Epithele typhae]|uniref:NAD-P-binding protein n=1 Tax=Epithele typhae TaxID=378194 RepID=UPI002007C59A|nr:NAD-P-binding protein [Epithele typhae]KAH9945298.1 NAD-P-binding protein [Epithele typhae]
METLSALLAELESTTGLGPYQLLLGSLTSLYIALRLLRPRRPRLKRLPPARERVLILGASSGIGRAIAHEYAARGARVCVVGRRERQLGGVVEECTALFRGGATGEAWSFRGDFGDAEDMVELRDQLEKRWGGLDTLVVSAGVSALRPLLEVAGLERRHGAFDPPQVSVEGVKHTAQVATKAMEANFLGPLVSAVTFIPLLSQTSPTPAICQISSLAALCPAPTRSLYCATKSAALLLYQALAIEHPDVAFTNVIPSTVAGDFRASAVDGGAVRELDPNVHGLKVVDVARRAVRAIDGAERYVLMPYAFSRFGHFGYWPFPAAVERMAARKYNFTAP